MKVKKVLVSQPRPTSEKSPYFDIEAKHGVELVFRQMIKVEGLSAKEFRQSKLNLADFTAIIFTSRHAVDHFFRLCEETRVKVPDTLKYFCVTEAIALYLQKYIVYRKRKIFFGKNGKLDDPQLMAAMEKNSKETFLLPVSSINHDDNDTLLEKHGIHCTKAVMYRTVSNDFGPDETFDYDAILFFSPAGIDSLKKNFPNFNQDKEHVFIGAFGTSTAKAVTDAGFRLDFSAPSKENPSMASALDNFLKKQNSEE